LADVDVFLYDLRFSQRYVWRAEESGVLGCDDVEPHGVTSQETALFIVTAAKTSNLT
jgi:hypothetical protein